MGHDRKDGDAARQAEREELQELARISNELGPLSPWQIEILRQRLADWEENPDQGKTWAEVERDILASPDEDLDAD